MSSITSVSPRTLADVISGGLVRSIALVAGGAALVGLTAQIAVPSFTAEVLSSGQGGHAVVVPAALAASFARRRVPVVATVNGGEYRSRLMVYGGTTYLGLRKDFLRQLGVGVGDQITVELAADLKERVVVEPPELLAVLEENPAARQAYDALSFSHRMEYARWIDEGKKAETRADRVAKTIRRLSGS